jgi:von Willebrand factor A domain-containing protein 7
MRFPTPLSHRQATSLLIAAALILTPLCNFRSHSVQAFMPGIWSKKLSTGLFTKTKSHEDITEMALMAVIDEFFNIENPSLRQRAAINIIGAANGRTDLTDERHYSAPHFDGENFHGAQQRLTSFKSKVISLMQGTVSNRKVSEAQEFLGRALHTLQDFYSHSNWTEAHPTGSPEPFHLLGNIGTVLNRPDRNAKTCEACIRDNCDQCDFNLVPGAMITTGYYGGDRDTIKRPGKCAHGGRAFGVRDTAGLGVISSGINKDTTDCAVSPREDLHPRAVEFAVEATKEYMREIRNAIGNTKMSALLRGNPLLAFVVDTTGSMGNEIASVRQQILQIINTRISLNLPTQYILIPFNDPSLGPITVTDDPGVFTTAVNALSASAGGDCPEPLNAALLQAFSEVQSGGDMFLFTDARAKDSHLAFTVGTFAQSSGIRLTSVFSGADAGCPILDGSLGTLSFDTGGQFFSLGGSEAGLLANLGHFLAVPNQTELLSRLGTIGAVAQNFTIPVDSFLNRMVLSVTGTGATNIVVRRPDNSIVQSTDPNVSQISVSSGTFYSITNPAVGTWSVTIAGTGGFGMNQGPDLDYIADANEVNFGEPESGPSNQFETLATTAAAFQTPQQFSLRVAGESTIDVASFEFVEQAGTPAHPGYLPIMGAPVPGRVIPATLKLSAQGASTASVQLRDLNGTVLQTLTLEQVAWPGDEEDIPQPRASGFKDYRANVTVPSTPFQVYVVGQDTSGNAYQRVLPGVIRPQTVEIIAPPIANLHPGETMTYTMQVKNSGAADTFTLTGVDDHNFLAGISPGTFSLATNEMKTVKVQIHVPASTPGLTLDTLRFTVTGSVTHNTAIVGPLTVDPAPALDLGTVTVTPISGDGDAFLEAGEGASLSVQLINTGSSTATDVSASLLTSTAQVVVSQDYSDYPDINASASATNLSPFVLYLPPNLSCGQIVDLTLSVSSEGNDVSEGLHRVSLQTGAPTSTSNVTSSYTGPAVAIPDNNSAGVNVPITVSGASGLIQDLNFRIDGATCTNVAGATTVGINHTFVSDLVIKLRSPSGTLMNLITGVGEGGNNFCQTTLDDETSGGSIQSTTAANAPFTGTFKPDDPLSVFRGETANGVWTLNVTDTADFDVGHVRAFSLIFSAAEFSCNAAPADTTAPSCTSTGSAGLTTQDTGTGLAAINVIVADNVNVTVPPFTPGTTTPVVVTGTLIDPNMNGSFEIESVDVAGNVSSCSRTITGGGGGGTPSILLWDDFNDNNLQGGPLTLNGDSWRTDMLLTIFTTNPNVLVTETAQHLEIGPLLVNTADAYGGVATTFQYNLPAGSYSYVELVQAPSAQTNADAGFALGNFLGYYQIRVSHGSLIGVKNILGNETILFSIPYDPVAHRFLRIRHNSATGNVVFDTAPGNGSLPGTWVQRYSEPWNSTLAFNGFQFEMRGGTLGAESNQPGKAIFDNFQFGTLGP